MIKLLIVDDEYLVLDAIKYIVERNMNNVKIVGTAGSGRQAIEMAIDLNPDIVLMDIHMPGIDGIDAIKQIKENNNNITFVIITAYEYFDYAKDAVKLGVYDYLLKPVNKNKLIEIINKIEISIKSKKKAFQTEMFLREKINKAIPLLEGQFIYSQMLGEGKLKDVEYYEDLFGLRIRNGYIIMAVIADKENSNKEDNLKNSLSKQKFFDVFKMELKSLCTCLIGTPLLDRIIAYIPVENEKDDYKTRNEAISICERFIERLKVNTSLEFRLGIGRKYSIENFSKSCSEAYLSATYNSEDIVTHFEDAVMLSNTQREYPIGKENVLIHNILAFNENQSIKVFEDIFMWIISNYQSDMVKIKSKLIELLFSIKKAIPYEIEKNYIIEQKCLTDIINISNVNNQKLSFINYIKITVSSIGEARQRDISSLHLKIVEYINANFHKNISLNDVAKEVNLSYHYFSKFFKENMGRSFVDYLTELRIEKSKKLLSSSNMSIKEISYSTGYGDPNYYCKIFKKVTGLTPTEYKNSIIASSI